MIPITPYFISVKHPQPIPLGTDTKLIVGNWVLVQGFETWQLVFNNMDEI